MLELSRGKHFSRSFIIAFAVAMLNGAGGSVYAQSNPLPQAPIVVAAGPGAAVNDERPAPKVARYFTINEVLGKFENQNVNTASAAAQPVQVAAIDGPASIAPDDTPKGDEPFGLVTFRAPEGALWVKWRQLSAELTAEAEIIAQCQSNPTSCTNSGAKKFLTLVSETRNLPARAKIDRINRAINVAVSYTSDFDQHGVADLWSTPLATLTSGKGDCEDYAIAKYVLLRSAGFSSEDLRLVLVHDRVAHQDHAVVGVRQNGRWLMLDNRHEVLLEQKDAWHFAPLFALDQEGVKLFAAPYEKAPATVPAFVATGPTNTQPSANELDSAATEAPALRLDAFEPPTLRGRL